MAPRKPHLEDREDGLSDPALAPVLPDMDVPGTVQGRAVQTAARLAVRRGSALGRLSVWVFGSLLSLVVSVTLWDFVTGLLARNSVLGGVALALAGLAAVLLIILALREAWAFSRLTQLGALRKAADDSLAGADLVRARGMVQRLEALYSGRAELAWGRASLTERKDEVLDADALLALAETALMPPLDALAQREIERAARQVAMVTALVPLALADVAAALFANLRMIRRIAEIYGGRSGALGSWQLLRRVFAALIATGALALTDDLIGSVAGGGVLSKLSRRFGEGVVNGGLTARIGVAAMDQCRPLPFRAAEKPRVTALVGRALAGLFGQGRDGSTEAQRTQRP